MVNGPTSVTKKDPNFVSRSVPSVGWENMRSKEDPIGLMCLSWRILQFVEMGWKPCSIPETHPRLRSNSIFESKIVNNSNSVTNKDPNLFPRSFPRLECGNMMFTTDPIGFPFVVKDFVMLLDGVGNRV